MKKKLLDSDTQKKGSKKLPALIRQEDEMFESMDEIQELLKIFYKFFVGDKNKTKPQTEDNQPKYYKNKYFQPNIFRQYLTVDINEQILPLGDSRKMVPNTAINESDDILGGSLADRSMIEEDDGVDVNKEMKRRMTQLMDVDHVYKPSVAKAAAAKGSSSFKRVELPGMNEIEGTEEAFNLEPL